MRALILASLAACLLGTAPLTAQDTPAAVRGVWKVTQTVNAKGETTTGDGLLMLMERHYSVIQVGADRPTVEPGSLTDADKVKLFDTVVANAGAYEVSGKTLTMQVQFAKNQGVVGRSITLEIDVTGKTLVATVVKGPSPGSKITYERLEP
jgi:hypothetical protein